MSSSREESIQIKYVEGDLFDAPENTILVHACNTVGSWGGGIALEFRDRYPSQFEQYRAHCKGHGSSLLGTCLLIRGDQYDIACLFTSRGYGRSKDKPAHILAATKGALGDLQAQNTDNKALHGCRFNAGKFAVPWADTEVVLKELGIAITIYTPVSKIS